MKHDSGTRNDAYMRMYEKHGKQDENVNTWDDSRPVSSKTEQERLSNSNPNNLSLTAVHDMSSRMQDRSSLDPSGSSNRSPHSVYARRGRRRTLFRPRVTAFTHLARLKVLPLAHQNQHHGRLAAVRIICPARRSGMAFEAE